MAVAPPRLGPLVHRSVHRGSTLWLLGVLQFLVAMIVVELTWSTTYSVTQYTISDLGNTQCGPWPDSGSRYVCSPLHTAFDVSVAGLGLLFLIGAPLVKTAFPRRGSSTVGLGLLAAAAVGVIGVGVFPENLFRLAHDVSSGVAFVAANIGLMILGIAMFRDTRWDGLRAYTLLSGLVGVVASGLYLTGNVFALGPGGMERVVVAPVLLWLMVASIHLLQVPAYAPKAIVTST